MSGISIEESTPPAEGEITMFDMKWRLEILLNEISDTEPIWWSQNGMAYIDFTVAGKAMRMRLPMPNLKGRFEGPAEEVQEHNKAENLRIGSRWREIYLKNKEMLLKMKAEGSKNGIERR